MNENESLTKEESMSLKETLFLSGALFIMIIVVSLPVLSGRIPIGHDIFFHLPRIEGIATSLLGGQFPVRIEGGSLMGYGSPTGLFYPSLFLYFPAMLHIFGCSLTFSYATYFVFINFITAIIAWYSFKEMSESPRVGCVAAMLYLGFSYRLIDLYVRGALGEAMAMAFLPLALSGIYLTLYRSPKYWRMIVLGATGILQSHILSSLLLVIFAILMLIFSYRRLIDGTGRIISIVKTLIWTVLLNLWFYLPFINAYKQFDFPMKHVGNSSVSSSLETSLRLFFEQYAYLGLEYLGFFIIISIVYIYMRNKSKISVSKSSHIFISITLAILVLFLTTNSFLWKILELLPLIGKHIGVLQFSFRLAIFVCVLFAYGYGLLINNFIQKSVSRLTITVLLLMVISFNTLDNLYEKPNYKGDWAIRYDSISVDKTDSRSYINSIADELNYNHFTPIAIADYFPPAVAGYIYSVETMPYLLQAENISKTFPVTVEPNSAVSSFTRIGTTVRLETNANSPTTVTLPLIYYLGYEAHTKTGEKLFVHPEGDMRKLAVDVPAGKNEITVSYQDRSAWRHALWVSYISLFLFIYFYLREKQYKKYKRNNHE